MKNFEFLEEIKHVDYRRLRSPLLLREFGRNVQIMAEMMMREPNRQKRTILAQDLIRVMAILSPANKDLQNYEQRLWESLYRYCEYDLDVDCPYHIEKPTPKPIPPKMIYQPFQSKFKQYGRNIELMIQKAVSMPPGQARTDLAVLIANIMKQFLQGYANSYFNDNIIFEHLAIISNGKILLSSQDVTLRPGYALAKANAQAPQNITSSNVPPPRQRNMNQNRTQNNNQNNRRQSNNNNNHSNSHSSNNSNNNRRQNQSHQNYKKR